MRMLRKAEAIYLARGDSALEKKFVELLESYQLEYRFVQVCSHCLGQRRVTYVPQEAITYKGARICENCAAAELLREADFRHLGRAAKAHLARILKNRRNLDDVIGLLSLQRLEPELTRFDIIPASREEPTLPLESIHSSQRSHGAVASQTDHGSCRSSPGRFRQVSWKGETNWSYLPRPPGRAWSERWPGSRICWKGRANCSFWCRLWPWPTRSSISYPLTTNWAFRPPSGWACPAFAWERAARSPRV